MKHGKPITIVKDYDGEPYEQSDGYDFLRDDEEHDPKQEERLELLKTLQTAPYFMGDTITEESELGDFKKHLFEYIENRLFDVQFSEMKKEEMSTVGDIITELIEQGV